MINRIFLFGLATALLLTIWSAVEQSRPMKTLDISSAHVVTPQVPENGVLKYEIKYCKYTDAGAIVYRQVFHDDVIIPFPAVSSVTMPGCRTTVVPLALDNTVPPGKYRLRIQANFQVSSKRTIVRTFETDEFEVIPK